MNFVCTVRLKTGDTAVTDVEMTTVVDVVDWRTCTHVSH